MTYTAIAIDDERFALDDLNLVIKRIPGITLEKTFQQVGEALTYLAQSGPVDVIFCDLDLNASHNPDNLEGIRVAKELQGWCTLFYFFTGHPAYRVAGIDTTHVAGHLLKPVNPEKIEEGVSWLRRLGTRTKETPGQLVVRDLRTRKRFWMAIDAICCICTHPSEKDHLNVIGKDETKYTVYGSLKAYYDRLRHSGRFIQLNQFAVVAKNAIVFEQEGVVKVLSGHLFPVTEKYKAAFKLYLNELGG